MTHYNEICDNPRCTIWVHKNALYCSIKCFYITEYDFFILAGADEE
jgi:hypothetical protein